MWQAVVCHGFKEFSPLFLLQGQRWGDQGRLAASREVTFAALEVMQRHLYSDVGLVLWPGVPHSHQPLRSLLRCVVAKEQIPWGQRCHPQLSCAPVSMEGSGCLYPPSCCCSSPPADPWPGRLWVCKARNEKEEDSDASFPFLSARTTLGKPSEHHSAWLHCFCRAVLIYSG